MNATKIKDLKIGDRVQARFRSFDSGVAKKPAGEWRTGTVETIGFYRGSRGGGSVHVKADDGKPMWINNRMDIERI